MMRLRRFIPRLARAAEIVEHSGEGSERGAVLVQVLVFSVLGLVVSSMLLSGLALQVHAVRQAREAPQTFYAAESGINHSIQHIVNSVSQEDDAIEQFRVLAAIWNRAEPLTGTVGRITYEAWVVDVSPNLAFRAFVQKYADVTIEAQTRQTGMRPQMIRATYRLHLGPADTGGQRATRVRWQRI